MNCQYFSHNSPLKASKTNSIDRRSECLLSPGGGNHGVFKRHEYIPIVRLFIIHIDNPFLTLPPSQPRNALMSEQQYCIFKKNISITITPRFKSDMPS